MRVPTVRVKNEQAPGGFVVMNESDVTSDHELWPDQGDAFEQSASETEQATALRCMAHLVGFKNGKTAEQWLAQPGVTRLEQLQAAEVEILKGVIGEGPNSEIPTAWQKLHWRTQVKLAKSLGYEGEPSADQAKAHIASVIESRAAQ